MSLESFLSVVILGFFGLIIYCHYVKKSIGEVVMDVFSWIREKVKK